MDVGGDEPADGVEDRGLPVSGRLTAATLEASFCETLLLQPDKHSYSAQILIALDRLHRGGRCRSRCRRRISKTLLFPRTLLHCHMGSLITIVRAEVPNTYIWW